MTTPFRPPGTHLSREEVAKIEVGQTAVTATTARLLVATFLALVSVSVCFDAAAPLARAADSDTASPWSRLADLGAQIGRQWSEPAAATLHGGAWARVLATNRAAIDVFETFEESLETDTPLAQAVRPVTQLALTGWLGVGNERVYPGRDGWLFYRPDVEYVTGPGFVAPRQLAQRVASASDPEFPPQPDPRPAIVDFARQLEARGIVLVVVPTPVKPTVHPDGFSPAYVGRWSPLQNASYDSFLDDLEREGVLVFDPTPTLIAARRRSGTPQYLMADTHWRPEAMRRVAEALAEVVQSAASLPPVADPGYRVELVPVSQRGDTAVMLDLPSQQGLYPPESVTIARILGPDGSPWRSSRTADVLVLGDSFSNIYSLQSMGWGESAGLVEHLSYALRRPVDRVVQNDEGAFATRAALRRQLTSGTDRLAGKRVVVYQFATRELATGDWRLIDVSASDTR